jgi:outer membrane protein assembly factor BamB
MAEAARRFPRGVADPGAARAFVADHAGTVLALDLAAGEVRWRAGPGLRPVSVVGDVVVAARVAGRNQLELVMLDAADGRELRASEPLALPDWAQVSLHDTPDYALRADAEGGNVVLRWSAQARYRGGAPPGAMVQAAAERQAAGAARVDVSSGAIEPLPEPAGAAVRAEAPAAPSPDPDVLEQTDIGGTRYQLAVRDAAGGRVRTLIRAVDRATGHTLWETVIDEVPKARPRPPRP